MMLVQGLLGRAFFVPGLRVEVALRELPEQVTSTSFILELQRLLQGKMRSPLSWLCVKVGLRVYGLPPVVRRDHHYRGY